MLLIASCVSDKKFWRIRSNAVCNKREGKKRTGHYEHIFVTKFGVFNTKTLPFCKFMSSISEFFMHARCSRNFLAIFLRWKSASISCLVRGIRKRTQQHNIIAEEKFYFNEWMLWSIEFQLHKSRTTKKRTVTRKRKKIYRSTPHTNNE